MVGGQAEILWKKKTELHERMSGAEGFHTRQGRPENRHGMKRKCSLNLISAQLT